MSERSSPPSPAVAYSAGSEPSSDGSQARPLDDALATVEQIREWHQPYAGKPCRTCLVADGWSSCATNTALADVALRLRAGGASS